MYVAERVYKAIIHEEKEVFVYWFMFHLKICLDLCPLEIRNWIIKIISGDGMVYFESRDHSKLDKLTNDKKNL